VPDYDYQQGGVTSAKNGALNVIGGELDVDDYDDRFQKDQLWNTLVMQFSGEKHRIYFSGENRNPKKKKPGFVG
jgi:hypothetical protein